MMRNDVRLPDVEVRITVGAFDTFVVAFYTARDVHGPVEGVATIAGETDRQALVQILSDAISLIRSDGWVNVAELGSRSDENEKRPPF